MIHTITLLKKIGDLKLTLLKDCLTINLPCEQVTYAYSLRKRIFGSLVDAYVTVL